MPDESRRKWIEQRTLVLEGSTDPDELEVASTELAASDFPEALDALAGFLSREEFLEKLDPPEGPAGTTARLARVFVALRESPSPEVARLCLALVDRPLYLENDRKSLALQALASVAPMGTDAVEAFGRANEEGYFGFDALLLVGNGSPAALELFASMMASREVEEEARIELLHKGILPRRNRLPILEMVARLMADGLEEPVAIAAIESVFDYRPEWFTLHGPTPPGWRTASDDVLRFVMELGRRARIRRGLPNALAAPIEETIDIARALLSSRGSPV